MIERETETEYDIAIFREIARVHSIYIYILSDANNTTIVVTIYSSYNQHHIVMLAGPKERNSSVWKFD